MNLKSNKRSRRRGRTAFSAASHAMVYPAALVAVGAASAEGAIIVTNGPVNHHAGGGGTYGPNPDIDLNVPWDIDGDTLADFILTSCGGPNITRTQMLGAGIHAANRIVMAPDVNANVSTVVTPITTAMTVGPASSFDEQGCGMITHNCNDHKLYQFEAFSTLYPDGPTDNAYRDQSLITGVFGFRFFNQGLGITNYGIASFEGYARSDGGGTSALFQINSWAYETSGAAISGDALNSAVPEPSSLGLLALGAAGVLYRARKKKSA